MWSSSDQPADRRGDAAAELGVGDFIGLAKLQETATYVDDETEEENEYHLFEARSL